jgi:putative spermidine/putrescine transport system permease protein
VRLRGRALVLLAAAPAAVYVIFLVLPIAGMAQLSREGYGVLTGIDPHTSWRNYLEIVSQPFYVKAWFNTLRLALESAVATVIVGSLVAYFLWGKGGRLRAYLTFIILAPLLVNGIVRAYGWVALVGPAGGLAQLTQAIGLRPVWLPFAEPAVVLGFVHVFLPFVVILVLAQLDAIPASSIRAARNLGAGWSQVAYRVLIPLSARGIAAGFLLVFALTTASYAIPAILGGGRLLTVAAVIYQEENQTFNIPKAAAVSLMLTVLTAAVMIVYRLLPRGRMRVAEV